MRTEQDPKRLLRSFVDVGLQIAEGLDAEKVLAGIVERAMEVTGAPRGTAVMLDAEGRVEFVVNRGGDPKVAQGDAPDGNPLLGNLLDQRDTVRIADASQHPVASDGTTERFLGAPIEHRGALLGAVYLTKPMDHAEFTEEDEQIAEAMAAMAGVAIDNSRLFAAEANRAERAALLRHVASKVRKSLSLNEVLDATVETLGRAARVDRCIIRLTSEDDPNMTQVAAEWISPPAKPIKGSGYLHPISTLAARTRSTQWTHDISEEDGLLQGANQESEATDIKGVLSTPLEWGEELLGVVTFHTTRPRSWTPSDRALIEAASREVSVAINHARLYEEAIGTAERLRELDEMRSDFISMVSHELRSPMTVVAGIADILAKRRHKLSDERQTELIATLGREARRLTRLVSEVLDLEAIDQGRMELHMGQIDLSSLASEAIADAGEGARTKLVVEPGNTIVIGDYDKIKQVLLNLISNAAKFTGDSSPITVSVMPRDDGVAVSVADVGPGIPDEYKPRLFQRFSRVQATGARKPGSGLGLYLARIIIEGHNGEIWCDSTMGEGSTFSFRIPR